MYNSLNLIEKGLPKHMSSSRKGSVALVVGILIMVGAFGWIYDICYLSEFSPFRLTIAVALFIIGVVTIIWGSGKNP